MNGSNCQMRVTVTHGRYAARMSLRERKKADTRARVMAVALRLFAERGFGPTTCEEIAAAADVAPRTFFRYFPTKADVLFGDHDDLLEALREALATRAPEEPVVRVVRRWAQEGLDHLLVNPSRYLTRSGLVASIPAAHARSRQLDAEFEDRHRRRDRRARRAHRHRRAPDGESRLGRHARRPGRLARQRRRARPPPARRRGVRPPRARSLEQRHGRDRHPQDAGDVERALRDPEPRHPAPARAA